MKKTILTTAILSIAMFAQAGIIVLEGHYQGKNVFIQNPYSAAGVGFCTYEVTVNDDISTDEINSSAFEIDLTAFNLKISDPVVIKIKHKDGCAPKVLNPEVLKPKSTFEISSIEMSGDGTLKWTTTSETGQIPYVIVQKRWNKWVKVGEVEGQGSKESNSYEFKVSPHSGENMFRVKQTDHTDKPRYSETVRYTDPTAAEVFFEPKKTKSEIIFTGKTMYEIYDQYGNIVKRGYDDKIYVANMKKDLYYLNYDNKMGETFIKK